MAISNFFRKFAAQRALLCCWHGWQMEKTFKQKNFNNFVWTPLVSRVNIYVNSCLQVHFKVSGVWYCYHYLPPVSTTPVANLPLVVSLIPVAMSPASLTTAANLLPVSLIPAANLPPVSPIPAAILPPVSSPVVHLDLRIYSRIFEKIWNDPQVIFRGLGEGDSWKKREGKNLVTLSL